MGEATHRSARSPARNEYMEGDRNDYRSKDGTRDRMSSHRQPRQEAHGSRYDSADFAWGVAPRKESDGKLHNKKRQRSNSPLQDGHRDHGHYSDHRYSHGCKGRSRSPRRGEDSYRKPDPRKGISSQRDDRERHPITQSYRSEDSHLVSSIAPRQREGKSPYSPSAVTPDALSPHKRSAKPLPSQDTAFSLKNHMHDSAAAADTPEKQSSSLAQSGELAAETNTVAGTSIVLKYNEPPEARKPASSADWRLYEFKGEHQLGSPLQLNQRSCWLFGRERAVVDFPTEHPSCSKQHAVLQFRWVEKRDDLGKGRDS